MHFWFVNPLARQLGQGLISEPQGARYFLASAILLLLQEHYGLWFGPRSGWLFHVELVALVLITIVGVTQAWKANGGRQFVLRIICLSVPAGVRVFVLGAVFGYVLYNSADSLFDHQTFRRPEVAYDLVSYAAFIGFGVYYWYLIYRGMFIAARVERTAASAMIRTPTIR